MLIKFFKSLCYSVLMLGLNLTYAQSENKNNLEIHIGIYAPFSGGQAFIGRNILNVMETACDKVVKTPIHYSLYTLDDSTKSEKNAIATLQKFIEVHQINILVTEGSKNGLMVRSLAKNNNLLHFSMANNPYIADGKNNFLAWSPEYEQSLVIMKNLKQKKIKEIELISTDVFNVANASINALLQKNINFSINSIAQQINNQMLEKDSLG